MTDIKQKRTRKPNAPANDLLAALKWVEQAQRPRSLAPYQTHCRIADGWITAFEGSIAAGHRHGVNWQICPQTDRLRAAVDRPGIVVDVGESALTVTSGPLTVRVPALAIDEIEAVGSDGLDGTITNVDLLGAIRAVLPLCKEAATTVLESSVELNQGTATATNRKAILQAWHGLALPKMVIPRAFAALVAKQDGLTGIGWSEHTVTFWFGPDKWLRSNLYPASDWPDISRILDVKCSAENVPEGLRDGVEALLPHVGDDGTINMTANGLCTHSAVYDVDFVSGVTVNAELFALILKYATTIDFDAGGKIIFFGDNVRGALSHVST